MHYTQTVTIMHGTITQLATTLCVKKVPTFKLSVTLSNIKQFSKLCTAGQHMKFATKPIQHYPSQLRHVAATTLGN